MNSGESVASPRDLGLSAARSVSTTRTVRNWTAIWRRTGWTMSMLAALFLVQSAFWTTRVPIVLKIVLVLVGVVAAIRPADAMLILVGVVPLTHVVITELWPGTYPFAFDEAIVLSFLVGYLSKRLRTAPAQEPSDFVATASKLFTVVVLASAAVQVVILQVWHDYPEEYAAFFLRFLTFDYLTTLHDSRVWVDGLSFVSIAALTLEGLALFGCARTLCAEDPSLARRLTNIVAFGAAGIAVLGLLNVVRVALEYNWPFWSSFGVDRWSSPAIPSLNTAGSYLMLGSFLAFANAARYTKHIGKLIAWMTAGMVCALSVSLSGTRSAIVAGVAVGTACLMIAYSTRFPRLSPRRVFLASGCLVVLMGVGIVSLNPLGIMNVDQGTALYLRTLFAQTGLRMMASKPIFGVGVGQYENRYLEFAPRILRGFYTPTATQNAHDYFIWIAAELGLIGLGVFLCLLLLTLVHGWRKIRLHRTDNWLLATCGGLVAFIITWLVGQPMVLARVAYVFWIVLGLAIAPESGDARPRTIGRRQRVIGRLAAVAASLLVLSVPIRALHEISEIDMSRVRYGFHPLEKTSRGQQYWWTTDRGTFFLKSSIRAVEVPLLRGMIAAPAVHVDVSVDGMLVERMDLKLGEGRSVLLDAPSRRTARPFWRVDFKVTPWRPIDVFEDSTDARVLGVPVGLPIILRQRE